MVTRATLDLLDAAIPTPDKYEQWRQFPDNVRFENYRKHFLTDPVFWERHQPNNWAFALTWNEYRYADVNSPADVDAKIESDEPGVYIFYVRPTRIIYRFPQFALYIGISNERGTDRPLRERLKDYLPTRITAKLKRDNIDQMLQMYYGVLWVAYALAARRSSELVEIEKKLHGFVYPCYSRRDFPRDIQTQRRRFQD